MKKIYLYIAIALMTLLGSCGKEAPFSDNGSADTKEKGQIRKSALGIEIRDEERIQTRAGESVNLDDFKISFTRKGASSPVVVYKYGEMPEIVTLDRGAYTVRAEYGEDNDGVWDAPYYAGESDEFNILAGKITDDIGDVVCRLQNVKVSIAFAPGLTEMMSDDSYVEVGVTNGATLKFTKQHELNGNSGYFRHVDGVSLVATFNGEVEGLKTVLTKSYATVQKGYHYKITFKLNSQSSDNTGGLGGGLDVDATVTVTDVERNINVEEDEPLDDNERPKEGDDPEIPDNPDWNGPTVSAEAPLVIPGLDDAKPENGVLSLSCSQDIPVDNPEVNVVLKFASVKGFTEFYADIVSPNLTDEELQSVGLAAHLDLVNPGDLEEPLTNLGLPCNIGGEKNVKFDISKFMTLLAIFGPNSHEFVIHAKDVNGETVVTLKLNFK